MKIRLISHASVLVQTSDATIWTDPWLKGKVFNDSWALLPANGFDEAFLPEVTHLWISHEHPDHFNLATLRELPEEFKRKVIVLYQDQNPHRLFETLRKVGYRNFVALAHRRFFDLGAATKVYTYFAGTMDSCLAVKHEGEALFDVNDAKLTASDCRTILADLGSVDVVLNQFSPAVAHAPADYGPYLSCARHQVLENLSRVHAALRSKATIPFASLMYWSSLDNKHLNDFANRPRDVVTFCETRGQQTPILYPGDIYETGKPYDSGYALQRYDDLFAGLDAFPFDVPARVPLSQIQSSFGSMVKELRRKFPAILFKLLRPVAIRIPDLGTTVELSIARGLLRAVDDSREPDLIVYAQPLEFCFAKPYGVQTLAISGRYLIARGARNWRWHRAIFAMNNANVILRPNQLVGATNRSYARNRLRGWSVYRDTKA